MTTSTSTKINLTVDERISFETVRDIIDCIAEHQDSNDLLYLDDIHYAGSYIESVALFCDRLYNAKNIIIEHESEE